jgi:hypothetical protein
MIADVFKQTYKDQQLANGRQRRREPQRGEIRRAEPVEEDESD